MILLQILIGAILTIGIPILLGYIFRNQEYNMLNIFGSTHYSDEWFFKGWEIIIECIFILVCLAIIVLISYLIGGLFV